MAKALTPISVIASDICADLGDSNNRYKFSILRKLMAGWRELNLYVGQDFCVKTVVLKVDNVVCMPDSFVYETKVGIRRNGHIAMLTLDKNITKETLTQQQHEQQMQQIWNGDYCGGEYIFYNYMFNGGLGELYGYGGVVNFNGYYGIDRGKGEIYIGSLIPNDAEIVIEFKSDGSSDGLTLVPTEFWNCLKYYALSEWYASKNLQLAQYNRFNYEREYNKNQRLLNFRTALQMASEVQSYHSSNPK